MRVFDQTHYDYLNSVRGVVVCDLLNELKEPLRLRTAVDVGCELGHFSRLLNSGFDVMGVDSCQENIEESRRRDPGLRFERYDAEDPALRDLGKFDLVFCLGLLYHLENPLLALRNLHAMTATLLVEGVIFPGQEPVMGLVDGGLTEDQGLNHLAFYSTEACLEKMLFRTGFPCVYEFSVGPDHPEYLSIRLRPKVRTILAASHSAIKSDFLNQVSEPHSPWEPSDADSVARFTGRGSIMNLIGRF